jgi:hypothetical protein
MAPPFGCRPPFGTVGVGHADPVESLPDMRRPDARSAQIGSRPGISHTFQVSEHSGEPFSPSLARNLFAKNRCRSALADEPVELWPQVPGVCGSRAFAGDAEGLAGAASGPDGLVIRPSCDLQGVAPASDSCEKVTLRVVFKIHWLNIGYRPFVHISVRNQFFFDQIAQPCSGEWIYFVVVTSQAHRSTCSFELRHAYF